MSLLASDNQLNQLLFPSSWGNNSKIEKFIEAIKDGKSLVEYIDLMDKYILKVVSTIIKKRIKK